MHGLENTTSDARLYLKFVAQADTTQLLAELDNALKSGVKSILLLSCTGNDLDFPKLNEYLKKLEVAIFGGVFPAVIFQDKSFEQGSIICGFNVEVQTCTLSPLSEYEGSAAQTLADQANRFREPGGVIAIGDAISPNLDHIIGTIYNHLGPDVNVAGCGAGRLDFVQSPCVITNSGVLSDAVQIIHLPYDSGVGVHHGWEKISGPYLVTKASENIIHTLNYRPAFELYCDVVNEYSDTPLTEDNFLSISKHFPFGMEKLDDELVVRDPIRTLDNDLHCVGLVPEHTMLYILQGKEETLIEAAGTAAREAIIQANCKTPLCAFIFDCITRALFLEKSFDAELEHVVSCLSENTPMVGALTMGEIASSSMGGIQFLNKTTVINVLG